MKAFLMLVSVLLYGLFGWLLGHVGATIDRWEYWAGLALFCAIDWASWLHARRVA